MRDDLLDEIVDELRTLPPVNEAAVRRIVAAASMGDERQTPKVVSIRRWFASRVPLAAAAGLALAAGLVGYTVRGPSDRTVAPAVVAAGAESLAFVSLPTASRGAQAAVPTQFILDAPRATRVSLVGDFNAWDVAAAPLARDSSSGIWTITLPLTPGRHVYAFMVDGTTLTLDPRAPRAQDPDFGTPSSVVLVGAP